MSLLVSETYVKITERSRRRRQDDLWIDDGQRPFLKLLPEATLLELAPCHDQETGWPTEPWEIDDDEATAGKKRLNPFGPFELKCRRKWLGTERRIGVYGSGSLPRAHSRSQTPVLAMGKMELDRPFQMLTRGIDALPHTCVNGVVTTQTCINLRIDLRWMSLYLGSL